MSIITYLKETKGELKHVNWPTRQQVLWSTVGVLVISGVVAYFLGLFDALFAKILTSFIG